MEHGHFHCLRQPCQIAPQDGAERPSLPAPWSRQKPLLATASTIVDIVDMATSTVSTRLDDSELALLDAVAAREGFDRSTLVKLVLRRGLDEMRWDSAVQSYRRSDVTLSRAAEIAGVSVLDFQGRMESEGLELAYGEAELADDLSTIGNQ